MKPNNTPKTASTSNNSLPHRVAFRISDEQKKMLRKNAVLCGMSTSDYARRCIFEGTPKQRMTEEERKVFLLLSDIRGDLVHFINVLKGKSQEERLRYFQNYAFMLKWKEAVDAMVNRLTQILSYLSE